MKRYLRSFWVLGFLCLFNSAAFAADKLPYEKITPPQPVAEKGKLEVVEVFWYTCPHCYTLDPALEAWAKNLPDDVVLVKLPAIFSNNHWAALAQVYYVAEELNVLDTMHEKIFASIHKEKRPLRTMEDFAKLFKEHAGISKEDFTKALNSFSVDAKVRNAKRLTQKYGINAVPSLVVNGEYRMTSSMTGGYDQLLQEADKLLDAARQKQVSAK
ncbi:thiol:disulfide interchange protein DsbA/DsbL [Candidatus Venteria ishoeyi]|uniref:Thiol:disulfide interchange protein n=1 Tax=Candidatus Venteria ishoeyi TaxID=1899563 RepID=A0A1H6FED2_9GAMM|nr:thiol:disulfide interchange protein DsbA/DsbL [Candidatus Venteria ishoeyi]MDM8547309.1 thiol:disulfide interchange protein DsbA/DsbL [Candidatus Venteria ishoeyi]SEH07374.1 Thiol:disulfide interchange protein DsbA precursor [Candidatus Venteria ishoeyi]